MWTFVRSTLVWLVVIAMPVQGMAASTMALCGPSHQRMSAVTAAANHDEPAAAAHGHLVGLQAHAASAWSEDPASAADGAGTPAATEFTHLGKFTCSACASCCSTLAIPVSFAPVGEPDLVNTTAPALTVAVPSFVTEGTERPPRAQLA